MAFVAKTLDPLRGEMTLLIHGDARGADRLAARWAVQNGVPVKAFPANWRAHGLAAGPMRNEQMLVEGMPQLVIAFPGGRGTADMVRRVRSRPEIKLLVF